MKTNKRSSSSLTSLRVERSKLRAELEKLNIRCIGETGKAKDPFSNIEKEIEVVQERLHEVDKKIRDSSTIKRGIFRNQNMFHSPKKSTENIMEGIHILPQQIQDAVAQEALHQDNNMKNKGAIRKQSAPTQNNDENQTHKPDETLITRKKQEFRM